MTEFDQRPVGWPIRGTADQPTEPAAKEQLAAWRAGDRSTVEMMKDAIRFYIENDYPAWAPEAGHLYGLDDELDGGWGRSREEVLAEAERTFSDLEQRIHERS